MNKTRHFLCIILSIKKSLQHQIHFKGNIFGNKCCQCNEGSLYLQQYSHDKSGLFVQHVTGLLDNLDKGQTVH